MFLKLSPWVVPALFCAIYITKLQRLQSYYIITKLQRTELKFHSLTLFLF